MTDQALKAAVERALLCGDAADYFDGTDMIQDHLHGKTVIRTADLRTLLAALSSQASVMEAMAKGLKRIADGEADGLDLARDSMVLERAIKVARTALSQYRTLGGE